MELHLYLSSLLLTVAAGASAQIDTTIIEHESQMPYLTNAAWNNPAMSAMKFKTSLSKISARFYNSKTERFGEFSADTYIKKNKLTLIASALYNNGALHNMRFCENVDVQIVYPYMTYDAVGGNINLERYGFGGSVAINIDNQWTIGARGSYTAGLYYRNVDPRPRDITGLLQLQAGASYAVFGNYKIGFEIGYRKYKQSCDISFVSELGESKIYHLTGLGTHYARFAGQGHASYYNGNAIGGSLTFIPDYKGVYINISGNINKINYILSDLNKLPMAIIDSRSIDSQIGFKNPFWGIVAFIGIERRHGYENIFGDAATGQYPMIGTLGMHLINKTNVGIKGIMDMKIHTFMLSLTPEAFWSHYDESYLQPEKSMLLDNFTAGADARLTAPLKSKAIMRATLGYRIVSPWKSKWENIGSDNDDLKPFLSELSDGFFTASHTQNLFSASIGADIMICKNKYAISMDASYSCRTGHQDIMTFSTSFKF